ncbi:hypothetical protein LCGC14_2989130 [marine sediment metagenome]|uniref:Uncharacterized protein n=1 Tax=marine sediment metagenome TaxID=412755 RepID=A0A0F8ZVF8_9ZZZZ
MRRKVNLEYDGAMSEKELRKELKDLTTSVLIFLKHLDLLMKQPSSVERGKKIATLCNNLDIANDSAMHFGLGFGFKKIGRLKKMTKAPIKKEK